MHTMVVAEDLIYGLLQLGALALILDLEPSGFVVVADPCWAVFEWETDKKAAHFLLQGLPLIRRDHDSKCTVRSATVPDLV